MIHLAGPVVLAAALAGAGAYGLLARRNAVLVLIGAELLLNAVNVLLVTAGALPSTGLAGLRAGTNAPATAADVDPLLPGPVLAIMVITIAAAEIGLALAVVLLVFRERATSDLLALRELGEAGPSYSENPGDGELPPGADHPQPAGQLAGQPVGQPAEAAVGAPREEMAAARSRTGAVR